MKVFVIPFRIEHMKSDSSTVPSGFSGGYVSCFSSGSDYKEATEKALKALIEDGIFPAEVLQPIHEMDSEDWTQHISDTWPELVDSMLSQDEFDSAIERDEVVYGPFGMYT